MVEMKVVQTVEKMVEMTAVNWVAGMAALRAV